MKVLPINYFILVEKKTRLFESCSEQGNHKEIIIIPLLSESRVSQNGSDKLITLIKRRSFRRYKSAFGLLCPLIGIVNITKACIN